MRRFVVFLLIATVAGCSTPLRRASLPSGVPSTAPAPGGSPRYYKDDGPGDNAPADLDALPDAVPRLEPLHRFANRPYTVLGREYVPATSLRTYRERGIASWYGRKFHGQKTSIGETYDMYAMTAAHPTLPLPSYARVTNVATGRSVIVRVNDRGPFLHDRVIDLSFAAAHKVGIAQPGSGEVEVEAIVPGIGGGAPVAVAAAPLAQVAAAHVVAPPAEIAAIALPAAEATRGPPGSVSAGTPATGFAVQLGAFSSYPNAQNFLAHVQNQMRAAEVEAKVRQSGGLFRVYVGPYADRDEARRVGERITSAFGFAATVAPH